MRLSRARAPMLAGACVTAAAIGMAASACGATAAATCRDFVDMTDADRDAAVLDWAREHDELVRERDPTDPLAAYALRAGKEAMTLYCSQPEHAGDELQGLRLDVGFQM